MSTDQQPTSYDPRYDGIYQRGGAAPVQARHDVEARRVGSPEPSPAQASAPAAAQQRTTTPAFAAVPVPLQRRVAPPMVEEGGDSVIREVGAQPEAPQPAPTPRNPFDVWVWVAAAVLTGLGVFFLAAPIVSAEDYAQQMMSQTGSSMYTTPWYQYTLGSAPTLILLGLGTAVVQLFILSIRHTLRTR